jgi:hypothetical protein
MYAAAQGKSTLGIPKKVGAEFVKSDKPGKLPERKNEEKAKRSNPPHYAPLKNLGKGSY